MPRLFQHLLAAQDDIGQPAAPRAHDSFVEDDQALGWESAVPSLQFECWEPAPFPHEVASSY